MKRILMSIVATGLVAACGPKPAPLPVPRLPGDGDANVAKPPPAPTHSVADDPWAGHTDLISPPAPEKPKKLELPPIDQFKLANGLQVFVVETKRLPVVSMQVAVRAGRLQEPRARLGVSEATADMLVKGTKRHSAAALAKTIDFVGGTISAEATFEATLVSCSVLAKDTKTCLDLMPEMVTQPTFPDDELAKIKQGMVGSVRQRLDDAASLASAHVQNLLWGNDHVRGWINSEDSVQALHRDDLVAWHKTWFVPNNAMLVVSGDVDAKKLKGELERAFAGWKRANVPPTPQYKDPELSGIRIRLVDKPGQTQTHIRIGQLGISHTDPRFFDTLVWNHALGSGGFSSRLMKIVRVVGGKTYGASSSFDRNLDRGSFVAQTFTRNREAVATTKLMLGELAKMAKDGPTQDEVDAAIANIAGGYGMRFQAAADIGAALIGAELHNYGLEYLQNYPLAVGAVDVNSAKRAASEILDPRNYVIVMVGDAKDLEPELKKEGWRYEKVAFTDPISPEPRAPEAPVDAKALKAAHAVIDQALAAKGGKAKLVALRALRIKATGTTNVQGHSLPVEIERLFVVPDKMRIDALITTPQKKLDIIVAVTAKGGWQQQPGPTGADQITDIAPQDMATIDFERWREPELILLKAADPNAKLAPLPDDTIDGKPQTVVRLGSPSPSLEVALYFDKKTHMLTRMSYTEIDPKGGRHTQSDDFADYRDTKGIKVAYKRTSTNQDRLTTLDIQKVEIDPKVDDALFAKPAAAK
ncbi:MAG: insulinase family protein [Acidobacteriota bacterium]